jgi:hypothetical protein
MTDSQEDNNYSDSNSTVQCLYSMPSLTVMTKTVHTILFMVPDLCRIIIYSHEQVYHSKQTDMQSVGLLNV